MAEEHQQLLQVRAPSCTCRRRVVCFKLIVLLLIIVIIQVVCMTTTTVVAASVPLSNSIMTSPHPSSSRYTRKLHYQQREVIPPLSSNSVLGEPTCEELRAMWRYYKRQSRAELTNEIPRFGSNMFWDAFPSYPHQQQISSFAPIKGRSRARLKIKNPKAQAYGKMVQRPSDRQQKNKQQQSQIRPMEQVAKMMGKTTLHDRPNQEKSPPTEGIIHLSPPPSPPTTPTSLQQIKQVFREERIRDKGSSPEDTGSSSSISSISSSNNLKSFGRIILSPPRGMDGRIANKPRELMTPFEQIRFGHVNNLLDDGVKPNPSINLMEQRKRNLNIPGHAERFVPPDPIISLDGVGNSLIEKRYDDYDDDDDGYGFWASPPLHNAGAEPANFRVAGVPMAIRPPAFQPVNNHPTCQQVEGRLCHTNTDCACVGNGVFRCHQSQCQVLLIPPAQETMADDQWGDVDTTGGWHSDPAEENQLGMWHISPNGNTMGDIFLPQEQSLNTAEVVVDKIGERKTI